jgi:hypothetical protein
MKKNITNIIILTGVIIVIVFNILIYGMYIGIKTDFNVVNEKYKIDSLLLYSNLYFHPQKEIDIGLGDTSDFNYKLIFRYTSEMCQSCVYSKFDLYEKVFKKDTSSIIIVGDKESTLKFSGYRTIKDDSEFLEFDKVGRPYYVLLDKNSNKFFFIPPESDNDRILNIFKLICNLYFY